MTVLIADDDDQILLTLKLLLKSEGMACVTCRSPQEALEAARRGGSQLALVDLNYVEDTTSGKEALALISALREVDRAWTIRTGMTAQEARRSCITTTSSPREDRSRR
jgi:DNA-binding response OmpR family regulator